MAHIPFNPNVVTPNVNNKVTPRTEGFKQNKNFQGIETRAQLGALKSISGALNQGYKSYKEYGLEQDKSDSVGARTRILALQQKESEELRSTKNPFDIDKISSKYKKLYTGVVSGKDEEGLAYFRNESGKNSFKENYLNGFNSKRENQASEIKFNIDRQNTSLKLWGGIKAVPLSDYYTQPEAETEVIEYVDELEANGFLTSEQANIERVKQLGVLDQERANRELSQISTDLTTDASAPTVQEQVAVFDNYVDSLKNLDDNQKKVYKNRSKNLIIKNNQRFRVYEKNRQSEEKKYYNKLKFDTMIYGVETQDYEGIVKNDSIPIKIRTSFVAKWGRQMELKKKLENKNNSLDDKNQAKLMIGFTNELIANDIYSYNPVNDPYGERRAELSSTLASSVNLSDSQRNKLVSFLKNGSGVPEESKGIQKLLLSNLKKTFGLTEKSKSNYRANIISGNWKPYKNITKLKDIKDSSGNVTDTILDGLNELDRLKEFNIIESRFRTLLKFGKVDEAEKYIKEKNSAWEKSQNDLTLSSKFFKRR